MPDRDRRDAAGRDRDPRGRGVRGAGIQLRELRRAEDRLRAGPARGTGGGRGLDRRDLGQPRPAGPVPNVVRRAAADATQIAPGRAAPGRGAARCSRTTSTSGTRRPHRARGRREGRVPVGRDVLVSKGAELETGARRARAIRSRRRSRSSGTLDFVPERRDRELGRARGHGDRRRTRARAAPAREGHEVSITVSNGAGTVVVPNVEGQPQDTAVATLQGRGVTNIKVIEQETDGRVARRTRHRPGALGRDPDPAPATGSRSSSPCSWTRPSRPRSRRPDGTPTPRRAEELRP